MSRIIQVNTMAITPTCRDNKTAEGAWQEAVERLRREYEHIVEGWDSGQTAPRPTLKLTLVMERPDNPHGDTP